MKVAKVKNPIQCLKNTMTVLLILAVSACSGSGGSPSPGTASTTLAFTASGGANLGVVLGGMVYAYKWENGTVGAFLAKTTTDMQGNYTLNFNTYTGPVLLQLSDNNGNTTFLDEFTGTQSPYPAGVIYRSIMPQVGPELAAITPLTELVTIAVMKKVAAGLAPARAIADARREVGLAFLDGADPLTTIPWDLRKSVAGASPQSQQYAAVLAGIQRLAGRSNINAFDVIKDYETKMYNVSGVANSLPKANVDALTLEITNYQNNPPQGLNAVISLTLPSGSGTLLWFSKSVIIEKRTHAALGSAC